MITTFVNQFIPNVDDCYIERMDYLFLSLLLIFFERRVMYYEYTLMMILLIILYWGYHIYRKGFKNFGTNQFIYLGYKFFMIGVFFFAWSEYQEGYGRWKHMVWHFCFHLSIILCCTVYKELKYTGSCYNYIKMILFTWWGLS